MQHDRKSKEDTWKSDELKKHLKVMHSEGSHDKRSKERRQHREKDVDEQVERKPKSDKDEDKYRHKYTDRDRHADRDKRDGREHRREKDKGGEMDKERHHISERHMNIETEKLKERKSSSENPARDYGTRELNREERKMRESLERSKHGSEDRERRHLERREKERERQENEDHEDRDRRHRKHREDLYGQDTDQDRRAADRKRSENSDRDKRRQSRQEKGARGDAELRSTGDLVQDRTKEKHSREKERRSKTGDKERQHREKDQRAQTHERRKTENQETKMHQRSSKESLAKQDSADEKEIEETLYNTDSPYDDSTNYEEDFEDYDDDFEEGNEEEADATTKKQETVVFRTSEIEEIQKAILLENENIASLSAVHRQKVGDDHRDQEPALKEQSYTLKKGSTKGLFIDFGSAKQRQVCGQIASKQKKRSVEILRLVDMDFSSTFSLLDLAPVKEYEMYIRNFGKTNTKQAYVQCNDDAIEREAQTEEIDFEDKWTQHPGEGAVVCGGYKDDGEDKGLIMKVDSQRLTSFLRSACQVIAVLLEENCAENQSSGKVQSKESCMSISESCFSLNTTLPFLQGRSIYHLHFSEAERHLLLTVHGRYHTSDSINLSEKFIICVWNIWQPSTPQKMLVCVSEVRCCCFSPGNASLVFAGTLDGSVLVWDLREDFTMHHSLKIEDTSWTFRSATFSTDGVFTPVNHKYPVKAIEHVHSAESKDHGISPLFSPEESSGFSFQVASLDESGHIIFWVVVELKKVDLAGSQSDLGLIPGGKVKLIHSSSIHLGDKFFRKDILTLGIPEASNIKFLPQDSNHFVVGTDIGIVTHGTRYGLIEPPTQYTSLNNKLRPSQVTAIDFSPFRMPAFLAGCSDGSIRLHTINTEFPVMQWNDSTSGQPVTALQWSLTRPTVFFVLDAASSIYIWDLLQNDLIPVASESTISDRVQSMAVFGELERNNNLMGLALAKSSGKVEIHYIKKKWAKTQPDEMEKMHLILQEIL